MKTTLDIPDSLFRLAKATAAQEGRSLKSLVEEALQDRLAADHAGEPEAAWMKGFGGMAHRRRENRRIQKQVDAEFGQIEAEDLA